MNELFAAKYDLLLTEFNHYVLIHPEFLTDLPDQAMIVLIDPEDPEFNRQNIQRALACRPNDDVPNRPIAYVDIGKLAPIQSRLVSPRLLARPPEYALAV